MGFKQTTEHRFGKGSFHQIGLVRGQFGNVPMNSWLKFLEETGFDGWEEASWELDLRRCDTDEGAAAYARERVDLARKHGLEIFTVATHLQGQVLGDEPSARTLNFYGKSEAGAAYKAWRDKGNKPPRTNPYYVPDEVGRMLHEQAQRAAIDAVIAIIEPAALTKIEDKPRTRRNLREEALRVIRENNNSAHTDTIAKALVLKVRAVMPSLRYLADTKHITLGKDGICTMLLDGPVPARRAAPLPGLKPDMLGAE